MPASAEAYGGLRPDESFGVTIRTRGNATPCRLVRSRDRSGMPSRASTLGNWLRETRLAAVPNTGNFDVGAFASLFPKRDLGSLLQSRLTPREGRRWICAHSCLHGGGSGSRTLSSPGSTGVGWLAVATASRPSQRDLRITPTPPHTVNLGIQLIYEQSWVPLGHQPGETVRTVTLGPRQSSAS